MSPDPRIDAYIAKSADFAQPLLAYWREQVHKACPSVEETIKWSHPHFDYGGKILSSMAAFKAHCAFGFWYGEAVDEKHKVEGAMGQLGRITSKTELPPATELRAMIKRAAALIDSGAKPARMEKPKTPKPAFEVPPDLAAALKANADAAAHFQRLAPGQQREYVDWLQEAKRAETREKRLLQAVEWIGEGKTRNWKYQNC